ncbi:MAG: restriction endonuclease subunit S [Syntrophales bacterium]|nr:restriction endonuclease subunit S [Syntrophales bacterium]
MKNGWTSKALGEACQIKPPKSEARNRVSTDGLVSFLPMEDMGIDEKYVRATQTKPLSAVMGSYTYFTDGDVLLAKITPCFENGKLGIAEGLANGIGFGSSEYIVFRPKGMLSKEWLYYYLSRESFRVEGAARMSGAVGHKRVSKEFIESYPIPLPPLPEQQRIVGILDEAFEGIATAKANAEKNLQNARALFESHLQSVFTQRGEGWVEKKLGEMCERITKGSSPKWQGIAYVDKPGILFVTSENVGEYQILMDHPKYVEEKFNAKDRKSILKPGDVLTNIVGASIGRTAVFNLDELANINQAVCLIRCQPTLLNNFFLTYLLNSPVFKQVLHDNEVDNARANLSLGFFSRLPMPMPPIPKQIEIVEKLNVFREETQRLESIYQQKLTALEALKKSLLHQAFTGDL